MTKKSIHADYPKLDDFLKAMEPAFKNPATAYADKKIIANKLIGSKIAETFWKRLGGYRYLGEKGAFYYNLESRASNIYLKLIRKESVANQVYSNLRGFLKLITKKESKQEWNY